MSFAGVLAYGEFISATLVVCYFQMGNPMPFLIVLPMRLDSSSLEPQQVEMNGVLSSSHAAFARIFLVFRL